MQIIAYIDGGSRGNPGPAAAGFTLTSTAGTWLQAKAFFLGRATNNIAEYTALCKALEAAKQVGATCGRAKQIMVFSDSELLVKQINGQYKVKSELIRPLFQQAVNLLSGFEGWKVQHIPREKNKETDKLVNQALNLEQDIEAKIADSPATAGSALTSGQRTADSKRNLPDGSQGLNAERSTLNAEYSKKPIRLGVLISGGGTTLMNILEYIKAGRLNAEVALVISSRSTVAGVERAKNAGLDVKIIRKKDYPDPDRFSKRIEAELTAANVDLVVQGGWLCLWKIPRKYTNRVMNIHPALLPSFGGKGMFGLRVHEAVLAESCKISGCTVHFCTNKYDKGPIIVQRCCQVKDDDTPETLAARVFQQECIAYPQAIKLFAEGRLLVQNGKVKIKS